MSIRILLLQARRHDDPARFEELESFARHCGLLADNFTPWNLLDGVPGDAELSRHDAVMVGGSGDFYVSKGNLPNFRATLALLSQIVDARKPMFASCFGFQCLVEALGGDIVHDPDNTEVGTYELRITDHGRDDPLFGHLPETFHAQMGRKDRAAQLPHGLPNLASSERCPYQALRIPDAPIWASQFHPELDRERNLGRFMRYLDGYAAQMNADEIEAAKCRFTDSPHTEPLLRRFVELVFDL